MGKEGQSRLLGVSPQNVTLFENGVLALKCHSSQGGGDENQEDGWSKLLVRVEPWDV